MYGNDIRSDEFRPVRDLIAKVETTSSGNVTLRIGRERVSGWEQIAYVVLSPAEATELGSQLRRDGFAGNLDDALRSDYAELRDVDPALAGVSAIPEDGMALSEHRFERALATRKALAADTLAPTWLRRYADRVVERIRAEMGRVHSDALYRQIVAEIHHGAETEHYSTEELTAARLYCGGALATAGRRIDAELALRQRRDDDDRRASEGDEQRDYAEERYNAELMRSE